MTIPICVSLPFGDVLQISKYLQSNASVSDYVEIRIDYLEDTGGLFAITKKVQAPLIATNRPLSQGGKRSQTETARVHRLLETAKHGFTYVDIELNTPKLTSIINRLVEMNIKPIISYHDFQRTPSVSQLEKIVQLQMAVGAHVCKLVTTAKKLQDNFSCLSLVSKMKEKTNIVCFAMGQKGVLSRVFSPLFGAYFTYASVNQGLETASGQLSIQRLKKIYDLLGV